MFFTRAWSLFAALLISFSVTQPLSAVDVAFFEPSGANNSNANWPAVNGTYNQNFGVAFLTGSSTSQMDWVKLDLNTSGQTGGTASLTVALHATNNSTAYSAVATSTAYATDTVTFSMPTTAATFFTLDLRAAQLPNITAYTMAASTSYALILYSPSVNIGIGRTTNYTFETTNNFYTVSNGFTALDTFRNNSPNYTISASSYPTLAISFGETVAVPEPSTWAMAGIASLLIGYKARRKMASKA